MESWGGPKDLEEIFFAEHNARLLDELRRKAEHEERREMLRRVVAIDEVAFLDHLIALGIGPEQALVLRLIPLVFVAWADGQIDKREREAILNAAARQGLAAEEMAREILGDWLERRPDKRILQMWKDYVGHIWDKFTAAEQLEMRKNLFEATQDVARAAGGVLGLARISGAEQAMLDEIEQTFA